MSVLGRTPRPTALAIVVAAFLAGGLTAVPGARAAAAPAQPPPAAPGFLVPASARGESLPAPRSVVGQSSLVTLQTSLLPRRAEGQPIRFDLGRQSVTGRFTHIERNPDYTAWTGTLDVDLGSFTIVSSGSTYRASIVWPQGLFEVTRARDSRYWLTAVAPYAGPTSANDTTTRPGSSEQRAQPAARTTRASRNERGRTRIDVLFAYTRSAKQVAGGKAGLKAAVGQAAAVTNSALTNSGIKAQIRVKGLVRVKGHESTNVIKDLRRLQRPHDGAFDSAVRARAKRHADIVHLFTGGPSNRLCGAGAEPRTLREATPIAGASTSYVSCLPYIVATHELGHNLGADHISYPGVSHFSRMRGAYAWYDVPHHFITALGYYDPCEDVGDFTCVRIPWFSNPKGTYFGAAIGSRAANNAKVIKRIAPIVARYAR
jgi:hypothetical protein